MEDPKKSRFWRLATDSYRSSDGKLWVAALGCAGVVGNYNRGETMGLASDMGVSVDTIEDLSHAYTIYHKLCELDEGKFRLFVRQARRMPFIYYSHFRALYDAQTQYKLTDNQVLDLLMDVVQGEGTISSRGVDGHTRSRYGDTRGWNYYGARAEKELSQTLQSPDLPNEPEAVGNAYFCTFDISGKKHTVITVAANPQRAENIARKKMGETFEAKVIKNSTFTIKTIGSAISDSKHLLSTAHNWLGDKS